MKLEGEDGSGIAGQGAGGGAVLARTEGARAVGEGRIRIRVPIESAKPQGLTLPKVVLIVFVAHAALIAGLCWTHRAKLWMGGAEEKVLPSSRSRPDPAYPAGEVGERGAAVTGQCMRAVVAGSEVSERGCPVSLDPVVAAHREGAVESPVVFHVVRRGETLAGIARRYGVTVGALARGNEIVHPDRISVGARLAIPAGGHPRSARMGSD